MPFAVLSSGDRKVKYIDLALVNSHSLNREWLVKYNKNGNMVWVTPKSYAKQWCAENPGHWGHDRYSPDVSISLLWIFPLWLLLSTKELKNWFQVPECTISIQRVYDGSSSSLILWQDYNSGDEWVNPGMTGLRKEIQNRENLG